MNGIAFMSGIAGVALAAALYAAGQTIRDFRQKNVAWGVAGGAVSIALLWVAGAILLQPVETHAVKIDLLAPRP